MNVRRYLRSLLALASVAAALSPRAAGAQLQVEIADDTTSITIMDNGAGDANPTDAVIDFTLDGTLPANLKAAARVEQLSGPNAEFLVLTRRPTDTAGTFENLDLANALAFKVKIRSAATSLSGRLGWRLTLNGEVEDESSGDVAMNAEARLFANGISLVTGTTSASASANEALFSVFPPEGVALLNAAVIDLEYDFDLGPGDEMRLYFNQLPGDVGLKAGVFNHAVQCIKLMNLRAAKVAQEEQKADSKCIRDTYRANEADATDCIDDPSLNGGAAADKLLEKFDALHCDIAPAWGVNADYCCDDEGYSTDGALCFLGGEQCNDNCRRGACISAGPRRSANDFAHDVFGTLVAVPGGASGDCMRNVFDKGIRAISGAWKRLARCKKANFSSIAGDADLNSVCFAALANDTSFTAMRAAVLAKANACDVPAGGLFPGCAPLSSNEQLADCFLERARCRFCRGVELADKVDSGAFDCDTFDNVLLDGSCP